MSLQLPELATLKDNCIGRVTTWKKGTKVRVIDVFDDLAVIERLRRRQKSKVMPIGPPLFNEMVVAVSDLEF